MRKHSSKLAEAEALVGALVPIVKRDGVAIMRRGSMPMHHLLKRHGLELMFAPEVRQHPQAAPESTLDIWLEGRGKVFSAAWSQSLVNGFKLTGMRRGDWVAIALNLTREEAANA